MIDLTGADLWSFLDAADAIAVTTNGSVRMDGRAVMGRGCAAQAAESWPDLPAVLGKRIRRDGNRVHELTQVGRTQLVSFPVKPEGLVVATDTDLDRHVVRHMRRLYAHGGFVPGWACKAVPALIETSAQQLVWLADERGWKQIVLPRPGCGAGELDWPDVRPLLERHLDGRFTCVTH